MLRKTPYNWARTDPYQGLSLGSHSYDLLPVIVDQQTTQVSVEGVMVTKEGLVPGFEGHLWIKAGDILVPSTTKPGSWRRAVTEVDVTGAARVAMIQETVLFPPARDYLFTSVYWRARFYDKHVYGLVNPEVRGLEPGVLNALYAKGLEAYGIQGGI